MMILRFFRNEAIEMLAAPMVWLGLIIASAVVLTGLRELDLDSNRAVVLIVDDVPGQEEEGLRLADRIQEIEGAIPHLSTPSLDPLEVIQRINPSIILSRTEDRLWQATLRSRSIIDHRKLSRLGLMLAGVINRQTPWEVIAGTDVYSTADHASAACSIGERICSAYKWTGHPNLDEFCTNGPIKACAPGKSSTLLSAGAFAGAIADFCSSEQIQTVQKHGICRNMPPASLLAVVGETNDLGSHTKVFVPRTIGLIVIFVAFVLGCRTLMVETRHNTLNTLIALDHGRLWRLLVAKILVGVLYCTFLFIALLLYVHVSFGHYIKPGLVMACLPIVIAAASSFIIGVAAALFIRDEAGVYLAGCIYLLLLFILSGYIDEIRDGSTLIWALSHALPLKFILPDLSAWALFGRQLDVTSTAPIAAQFGGAVILLWIAAKFCRRGS
jgi:hypothetical protein